MSETIVNPGCKKCKYGLKRDYDYDYRCKHKSNIKVVQDPVEDIVLEIQKAEEKNKSRDCPYFEYNFIERFKLLFKGETNE